MPNGHPNPAQPPIEIPWQLAASTRTLELAVNPPVGSSLSILTHVPQIADLDQTFPDDRLVYLKVSVSLSPDRRAIEQAMDADTARLLLTGGPPIWLSVIDVRLSPIPDQPNAITPHFLSAAPLRRTVAESGVIGISRYEGGSEGMAVGKSGAELHEAFQSAVTQETAGGGGYALTPIPGVVVGGGGSTTTTDISGGRDVYQFQDTIARQASEERRELLSHLTRVHNVLTLLSGLYVGSPYLKFVLRPRPLRTLSIDTNDPNLWQHELLRRRSSGLEGIQDFYGVAVIPRALEGFCVSVRLRNVYVLDAPPPPLIDDWISFYSDPPNGLEILEYLFTRFPRGTRADDLDVDLIGNSSRNTWMSPSVAGFGFFGSTTSNGLVFAQILGIDPAAKTEVADSFVPYKMLDEVWLETRRAAYEDAVSRSPLERGVVTYVPHDLGVCFDFGAGGTLNRRPPTIRTGDTPLVPSYGDGSLPGAGNLGTPGGGLPRREFRRAWTRWSNLEDELAARASHIADWGDTPLELRHPRLFDVALRALGQLPANHPANSSLDGIAKRFKLSKEQVQALKDANVNDLRTFVTMLRAPRRLSAVAAYQKELLRQLESQRKLPDAPKPPVAPSSDVLRSLRDSVLSTLRPPKDEK